VNAVAAHRGVFGERNNAHELIATTNAELFRRIPAIEADLPSDAPVGLKWDPFIRGWPWGGYYFFARTEPDTSAKRGGMVLTQILAVPLAEAEAIENLEPVFAELANRWNDNGPLAPYRIDAEKRTGGSPSAPLSPQVIAVAEVLAVGPPSSIPAAFDGQDGFIVLIYNIWNRMPPTFRCELVFGFSFAPADLLHRKLHVVCFPANLAERWRTYTRRVDCKAGARPLTTATAFILGESSGAGVQGFIQQADLPGASLATLSLYVRAAEYWAKRAQLDFHGWCALAKDITRLAPEAPKASEIKSEVTAALERLMETGGADGVLSLRNMSIGALGGQASRIGGTVKEWISKQFESAIPSAQESLLKVVRSLQRPASVEWVAWVNDGLAAVFGNKATAMAAAKCWNLWLQEESAFDLLATRIPDQRRWEEHLTATAPSNIGEKLGLVVAAWCVKRQWWTCYAKVLLAWKKWESAIQEYLATDLDQARLEPVRLLLSSTDPPNAIAFAISNQDGRLRNCGAEICVSHPEVFSRFDGHLEGWRDILRRSVSRDSKLVEHLGNGQAVLFALLDCLLESNLVEEALLASFAGSRHADLTGYPKRAKIYNQLPIRWRGAFVAATAKGWLDRYLHAPSPILEIEATLRQELMSESLQGRRFSPQQTGLIQGGIAFLKGFEEVTEALFLEWADAVAGSQQRLSDGQARDLADLLKEKSWETGAWRVKHHADELRRADLRSVWDRYWSLFGWQERLLMRLAGPPVESRAPARLSRTLITSKSNESGERKALFVTALNLEFIAVQSHLVDIREKTVHQIVYAVGVFIHQGQRCEVIVALAGMGNVESSLATERAIAEFSPDYAFFVGIAGGLKDELKLGDVVAADKVYAYESGKAQKTFFSRPKAPSVSFAAIQRAGAVAREGNWLRRIRPHPVREPAAYVKPIAAGEKVVDSHESEVFALIKRNYGDAYAVAMEEFGFAAAAQAHPTVTYAVVRGISDAAQDKAQAEGQNSQQLAARHAAAFAFEMLAGFLEADRDTGA
jgi:nucleoside phosphorylase